MFKPGIRIPVFENVVVGENEETLAVPVESSNGIDIIGKRTKVGNRLMSSDGCEL
jgi:hypothetical protein